MTSTCKLGISKDWLSNQKKKKKGINQLNNITCIKNALGDLIDFGVTQIAKRQKINEVM